MVDQIEPPNIEEADSITISLDALDADWIEGQRYFQFDPEHGPSSSQQVTSYWKQRFGRLPPSSIEAGSEFFDQLPLFQIEITLARDHQWIGSFLQSNEWLQFFLSEDGDVEADVFGGLFSEPVVARVSQMPKGPNQQVLRALNALFDTSSWPDASRQELLAVLDRRDCEITQLNLLDVGQGSATGIICRCGFTRYYFDVGCGVYRNAGTNPTPIQFCICDRPPIILSHWDSDHWGGAAIDKDLLSQTWIAPRQKMGAKHVAFANEIISAGGRILLFPQSISMLAWGTRQQFVLQRCSGAATDRNGSGLILIVTETSYDRSWLLTGDAPYNLIPGPIPSDLAGLVVPHHGADMGFRSVPPGPSLNPYSRLLYSFGPGNAHGRTHVRHPTARAVAAHNVSGWTHGAWSLKSPGHVTAGPPVLATAAHMTTHLGGAAVGWTGVPRLGSHAKSCPKPMPIPQF